MLPLDDASEIDLRVGAGLVAESPPHAVFAITSEMEKRQTAMESSPRPQIAIYLNLQEMRVRKDGMEVSRSAATEDHGAHDLAPLRRCRLVAKSLLAVALLGQITSPIIAAQVPRRTDAKPKGDNAGHGIGSPDRLPAANLQRLATAAFKRCCATLPGLHHSQIARRKSLDLEHVLLI
jgi:hypothetical protein